MSLEERLRTTLKRKAEQATPMSDWGGLIGRGESQHYDSTRPTMGRRIPALLVGLALFALSSGVVFLGFRQVGVRGTGQTFETPTWATIDLVEGPSLGPMDADANGAWILRQPAEGSPASLLRVSSGNVTPVEYPVPVQAANGIGTGGLDVGSTHATVAGAPTTGGAAAIRVRLDDGRTEPPIIVDGQFVNDVLSADGVLWLLVQVNDHETRLLQVSAGTGDVLGQVDIGFASARRIYLAYGSIWVSAAESTGDVTHLVRIDPGGPQLMSEVKLDDWYSFAVVEGELWGAGIGDTCNIGRVSPDDSTVHVVASDFCSHPIGIVSAGGLLWALGSMDSDARDTHLIQFELATRQTRASTLPFPKSDRLESLAGSSDKLWLATFRGKVYEGSLRPLPQ